MAGASLVQLLLSGSCHQTSFIASLVQVMVWYHKASSHYLSLCWARSISSLGHNELRCSVHHRSYGFSWKQIKTHKSNWWQVTDWLTNDDQHPINICQTSNIRQTKSPNLYVSHLILQLSLPNPLKHGIKSRMKMKVGAAPTGNAPTTSEWSTIL